MKFDFSTLSFIEDSIDQEKLAVSGSDKDLSWKEFAEAVEQKKKELEGYNLPAGHPIVIYGHAEAEFVVTITACMALRYPYIPVDTIYPRQRLQKIQNIVESSLLIDLELGTTRIIPENRETSLLRDDALVYIMFTSGSTGEPKGVEITRSALSTFAQWVQQDLHFAPSMVYMNQPPFSFDVSVYGLVGQLFFGGSLVLSSREILSNPTALVERMQEYACTTWVSTPSFTSRFFLAKSFATEAIPTLKTFLYCGETLPPTTVVRLKKLFPYAKVFNTYGPTEATVAVTQIEITDSILEQYPKVLPIGYVMPQDMVLIDAPNENGLGEMVIVGDNVSTGYFKQPELSVEKFGVHKGVRSFRTGDSGYYEGDLLFFATRNTDYVKLHGFRIETREIDVALTEYPSIDEAFTLPLKRGEEVVRLVSFVISRESVDATAIKERIEGVLPSYMIPSEILQIEEFPYSANHKIDKKQLLAFYMNR